MGSKNGKFDNDVFFSNWTFYNQMSSRPKSKHLKNNWIKMSLFRLNQVHGIIKKIFVVWQAVPDELPEEVSPWQSRDSPDAVLRTDLLPK